MSENVRRQHAPRRGEAAARRPPLRPGPPADPAAVAAWGARALADGDTAGRRAVLRRYRRGAGALAVVREESTVEGAPLYTYLRVERGRARVVFDPSHDPWGDPAAVPRVYECADLYLASDAAAPGLARVADGAPLPPAYPAWLVCPVRGQPGQAFAI